jgi:hypothetical protein
MLCSSPSSRLRRDSSSSALRSRCPLSSPAHLCRRLPRRLGRRSVGASTTVVERGCRARSDWLRLFDRRRCPRCVGIRHFSPRTNGGDPPSRREPARDEWAVPLHAKPHVFGQHDRLPRRGRGHQLRVAIHPAPDCSGRARPHRGVARRAVPERCIRGPVRGVSFARPALVVEDVAFSALFSCPSFSADARARPDCNRRTVRPRDTAHQKNLHRRKQCRLIFFNAPGGTRTPNLLIRSQMLYPIELRALIQLCSCSERP